MFVSTRDETQFELASSTAPAIRQAKQQDASAIWEFVRHEPSLDTNSCYAYLLLCSDFAETSVVAHAGDQLMGFAVGYVPPQRPEALFVWQIGVAQEARGHGLARRLLKELLQGAFSRGIRYLEATITPSNKPSWQLFQSLADSLDCELKRAPGFAADDFGGDQHEAEQLIRIGPLKEI